MPWKILYHQDVKDDLKEVPSSVGDRIRQAIEKRLMTSPDQYGERLSKDLSGLWKLRSGDYRIVFDIDHMEHTVTIWGIRHRRRVYADMARRWVGKRRSP